MSILKTNQKNHALNLLILMFFTISFLSLHSQENILWKYNYIQDQKTGKFITAVNSNNGTYLTLQDYNGSDNQLFIVKKWDKGYTFGSKLNEWQVFCTSRNDYTSDRQYTEPGHPIWLYVWMNGGNQFWHLRPQGGNEFIIANTHSGLFLRSTPTTNTIVQDDKGKLTSWIFHPEGKSVVLTKHVNIITKKNPSGQPGYFTLSGYKKWAEINTSTNVTRDFVETRRDGSKIYLQDGTVQIILDLGKEKIYYRYITAPIPTQLTNHIT